MGGDRGRLDRVAARRVPVSVDPRYTPPAANVDGPDEDQTKVGFPRWLRVAAIVAPSVALGVWILGLTLDGFGSAFTAVTFVIGIFASAILGAVTIVQLIFRPRARTGFSFFLAAINFLPFLVLSLILLGVIVRLVI
jgi:hypothetical protein